MKGMEVYTMIERKGQGCILKVNVFTMIKRTKNEKYGENENKNHNKENRPRLYVED
jgi:hypothetical protein